ncbi:hypothetical protein O3M35_011017 [Rhynocoris fuscipes]|uniref:Protein FAM195A n=1 Tax=Rhynocoris fuscipes TaxID=488301 RepID=A0AAW1CZ98_9HEMI
MSTNGKRMQPNSRIKDNLSHQHIPPVQQQEELIKFICDSWNKVCQEYQKGTAQGTPTVAYHTETEPNPMLKDFVPFDLEAFWGKRLVQNITTQNM